MAAPRDSGPKLGRLLECPNSLTPHTQWQQIPSFLSSKPSQNLAAAHHLPCYQPPIAPFLCSNPSLPPMAPHVLRTQPRALLWSARAHTVWGPAWATCLCRQTSLGPLPSLSLGVLGPCSPTCKPCTLPSRGPDAPLLLSFGSLLKHSLIKHHLYLPRSLTVWPALFFFWNRPPERSCFLAVDHLRHSEVSSTRARPVLYSLCWVQCLHSACR